MKRILLLFCSARLLFIFPCASGQPNDDNAIDLSEAYKIASAEALKWNELAVPYFITSMDDPIECKNVKGKDGKRHYWNFDFVVENTSMHLIITVQDKAIINKTEAESDVNSNYIIDIEELNISTADAVLIAIENYGLLPGTSWAKGYHFVLENNGSALILSVVGLDPDGSISRVFFHAKTGEVFRGTLQIASRDTTSHFHRITAFRFKT